MIGKGLPGHTGECGEGEKTCPVCGGSGEVSNPKNPLLRMTCKRCGGSGCVEDTGEPEQEYYAIP